MKSIPEVALTVPILLPENIKSWALLYPLNQSTEPVKTTL